jgi:hypothetical protein
MVLLLNKVISNSVFALAGLLILFLVPARAAVSYCAFEVKVTAPSGSPVNAVPVYLIRQQRTTISDTITDANGIARISDAPLETVDIGVGFDVCGSVLVRAVKPTWPALRQIFITYAQAPCGHFVSKSRCQVLLRIQDAEGRPVAGARFAPGSDASDDFGKLFRSIKIGETLDGVVVKEGRQPAHISERCGQHDQHDIELKVVLH